MAVTRRIARAWLKRKLAFKVWEDRQVSPKGVRYPRSKWDKLGPNKPFDWATPAANMDGSFPEPWRVPHADRALVWLKRMFPQFDDLYTDYYSDKFRGREQIWVGARDNRDRQAHYTKLLIIHDDLKKAGWPVRRSTDGRFLLLVDDIERDVLK